MNGFNGSGHRDFLDVPGLLGPVVAAHGQGMVALVYGAGMAAEAAGVLAATARRNGEMMHALQVITEAFNQVSTAYCKEMGWTEQVLGECDQAIKLAFADALVVAEGPRIVLDS
jgi:hypothetical protein